MDHGPWGHRTARPALTLLNTAHGPENLNSSHSVPLSLKGTKSGALSAQPFAPKPHPHRVGVQTPGRLQSRP